MPEPFKNFFNPSMIAEMGAHLRDRDPDFDADRFVALATDGLDRLELKQRSNHILAALEQTLPDDFAAATELMLSTLHPDDGVDLSGQSMDERGVRGWAVMPMADYVARHGLQKLDFSMDALREMTKRASSEFAVRPFLADDPDRALGHVSQWARDDSYHVRRLASEGTRPRLPWGMRLPAFIADPSPILPILETLKDDPEDYVRRSVANNLNDIAKDHPDLVASIACDWLAGSPGKDRQRLVRHACRTLIKAGHRPTLTALGYGDPHVRLRRFGLSADRVQFGESLVISIELGSTSDDEQQLVVDYVVHHRKANGSTSPKVFKWRTLRLAGSDTVSLEKRHAFRPITTRSYNAGTHAVEIQVNGLSLGRAEFELVL